MASCGKAVVDQARVLRNKKESQKMADLFTIVVQTAEIVLAIQCIFEAGKFILSKLR